jgi:hypothetical protein
MTQAKYIWNQRNQLIEEAKKEAWKEAEIKTQKTLTNALDLMRQGFSADEIEQRLAKRAAL